MESPQNVFEIKGNFFIEGRGVVAFGTLKKGSIKVGMKGLVEGQTVTIKGIEAFNKTLEVIDQPGTEAGILIDGLSMVKSFFGSPRIKIEPKEYSFE